MYDFVGESNDELSFAKGELIRVIDAVSDEWWRGELRGQTGIFPTNYVVRASVLSYEARQRVILTNPPLHRSLLLPLHRSREAPHNRGLLPARTTSRAKFSLKPLRSIDYCRSCILYERVARTSPTTRSSPYDAIPLCRFTLSEQSKIHTPPPQDLYNSSMALRPKVVQLIRKYDQKQGEMPTKDIVARCTTADIRTTFPAELRAMNDKVEQAKTTFERNAGLANQHQQQPYSEPTLVFYRGRRSIAHLHSPTTHSSSTPAPTTAVSAA